jgi:uncharacterized protein YqgV (UPF0045/DUF77 family)
MSVIARLEVIPVGNEHMTDAIAEALDALDAQGVRYETTATDTIIEAATAAEAFEAARAAHEAIPETRVITSLSVDDDRGREQGIAERVAAVERARTRRRQTPSRPAPIPTTAPEASGQQAGVQAMAPGQQPAPAQTGGQQAASGRERYGRRYAPDRPAPRQ